MKKKPLTLDPKAGRTITDFCDYWGKSKATFHRDRKRGLAPKVTYFGSRPIILAEDEQAWIEDAKAGKLATHND